MRHLLSHMKVFCTKAHMTKFFWSFLEVVFAFITATLFCY